MFRALTSKVSRQAAVYTRVANFHSTRIVRSDDPHQVKPEMCAEVKAIVDQVMKLNILQTIELVNELKSAFGYSDASFMAAAPSAAPAAAAAAPAAEEVVAAPAKTSFNVKLESFDAASKVKVIKEVRAMTGLGLKEAKELVEGAPKVIKKDLAQDEADKIIAVLKEAGAVCVLE